MDTFHSSNPYKQFKEEFVSNLSGSSMLEIVALTTIVPILILLRNSLSFKGHNDPVRIMKATSKVGDKVGDKAIIGCRNWNAYIIALAADFLFVVLPILLFFTVLAEWTQLSSICLTLLLFVGFAVKRFRSSSSSSSSSDGGRQATYSVRTIISSYRVSVVIVTCLCILAVDFKIFPRRYAKTETYGTGLMDLGVGSFVLANALVSRQARDVLSTQWKTALRSTGPLILLGFGRLISTVSVDYQVHVGEYGVHWNFFFTLAAVSILTSLISISPKCCGVLGLLVLIGYQMCLLCGLNDYLLSNKRTANIISQNKEGIFSIFGYWGLYLVGVFLGKTLFFGDNYATSRIRSDQRTRTRIWILAIMFWVLTVILDKHVERVSRRMCNLAYVTLVLAQNFQVLAILMLSEFNGEHKMLVLEEAFCRNLLGIFLLANVFTGLINMYVDTIYASSVTALAILSGYAFVLCIFAGFAECIGIKFKFW